MIHGYWHRPYCDWPYSSFHVYVKKGLLPNDWGYHDESLHDRGE